MGRTKCRTISILSWNVWFDFLELQTRTDLIIQEILRTKPDVPSHGYGNITLVKKELKPKFSIIPFPTKMGRKLTLASLSIGDTNPIEMVVGNIHLESLNNRALREQQLEVCRNSLPAGRSVLVGDYNIPAEDVKYREWAGLGAGDTDSEDSFSSHDASETADRDSDAKVPELEKRAKVSATDKRGRSRSSEITRPPIENDAVIRLLPDFEDAWHHQAEVLCTLLQMEEDTDGTYQQSAADISRSGDTDKERGSVYSDAIYRLVDEMGYTFDEAMNHKSTKAALHRKRIDRVLTSLQPEKFEFVHMMRIGTTIRSSSAGGRVRTIFPSDHFGLLYTCQVRYG